MKFNSDKLEIYKNLLETTELQEGYLIFHFQVVWWKIVWTLHISN